MSRNDTRPIAGVFPVLPTPFAADKQSDRAALQVLVRYLLRCGVDGMTFPGVASEVSELTEDERLSLTQLVLSEVAGRVPVVVGVSSNKPAVTIALAKAAADVGAAAVMVAAPVGPTVETNETSVLVEYRDGTKHQALGPATLVNDAVGRLWRSRVDGFWQVHPSAPAVLVDAVITAAQPRLSDVVWDLYAGVGLFAGALAPLVSDVVAVESEAASCRDGERNLKDLKTVKVVHERVDKWLRQQADPQQLDAPDIVVLDPPRKGAGASIVGMICGVKPRVVVYVACDPAALARDVALFAAQGYELGELRAYDLFPMTHHVECVAVFTLS